MTRKATTSTRDRLDKTPFGRLLFLTVTLALAAVALLPSAAFARTTRTYQSSFEVGSFSPSDLVIDQATGDVYVVVNSAGSTVKRFDASGAPKDFTAGPNAGTNEITGITRASVAVDNSGGPFNGDVYVADNSNHPITTVKVFSNSGALLGSIAGATTSEGKHSGGQGESNKGKFSELGAIAVDQTDGSLYVAENANEGQVVWRLTPTSPSGPIDETDYAVTGISPLDENPLSGIAAASGQVYVARRKSGAHMYPASSFTTGVPKVAGTVVTDNEVFDVNADPKNGDLYADEGNRVSVFDSSGSFLYKFGFSAYIGAASAGVAVKSAPSGVAEKAYVADAGGGAIAVFGPLTKASTLTPPELAAFGPDGTAGTSFTPLRALVFDQADRKLYALQEEPAGIYGFDASAPPAFPPLAAFDPSPPPRLWASTVPWRSITPPSARPGTSIWRRGISKARSISSTASTPPAPRSAAPSRSIPL